MIFFTQGFLFSSTEFRIKKNQKKRFQSYRIFFTRTWTLVINSFISENGVPAKREEKKECFFFHFPRKSSSSFNQILMKFLFLYKSLFCFFTEFLCVVLFFLSFSRKSSKVIHSFDFWAGKKMKKKAFSFIQYSS